MELEKSPDRGDADQTEVFHVSTADADPLTRKKGMVLDSIFNCVHSSQSSVEEHSLLFSFIKHG